MGGPPVIPSIGIDLIKLSEFISNTSTVYVVSIFPLTKNARPSEESGFTKD